MSFSLRLNQLAQHFLFHPIPENFDLIVLDQLQIDIKARYGKHQLKNCLIVAPGQMTTSISQIERIKEAGFAGCVLKSVVAEDEKGHCSMIKLRKKPTYVETVYDNEDTEGRYPIIHWDGGLDVRNLDDYLNFALDAIKFNSSDFLVAASILGHLPSFDSDFNEDEWIYTTEALYKIGYRIFEIDFCPFLKEQDELMNQRTVLRWYKEIPVMIKKIFKDINVFPKIMNLDYGLEFQIKMVESSLGGGADGVIIANRIYKTEYGCAHGGIELRKRNLVQIRKVHHLHPDASISGTGGIYTGKDIVDYINAGCENVQILSYLMGKVKKPFLKNGNRFQQVFYQMMFDKETGYLFYLLKQKEKYENR
ncbi:MAG: hypothetical protein ACP5JO_01610 [Candidatus Ratteibacteria bacterium]